VSKPIFDLLWNVHNVYFSDIVFFRISTLKNEALTIRNKLSESQDTKSMKAKTEKAAFEDLSIKNEVNILCIKLHM
jgi:hypothetical protein